ncbi:hypothetical protein EV363DRAFT_1136416, partial [Boletus edulis]
SSSRRASNTNDTPIKHTMIRFWRKSSFNKWLESPDAVNSAMECGLITWLEQENEDSVDAEECTAIKTTLCHGFAELVAKGWVPRSWGVLCALGCELVDTLMQKYHPIFKYDLDGWKLHHLTTLTYPQWLSQHLD